MRMKILKMMPFFRYKNDDILVEYFAKGMTAYLLKRVKE
ncbi:hypothetical protein FEM08_20410 [Flavobacterium gilvum]|nr:hypothetical protein FEM08_20410 [Flavobacterium gilvum]